jgi:putative transposase
LSVPKTFLNGISDVERDRAMERFRLLKPHLEDGVPLSQIAGQGGLRLRTARRWVRQYRKFGLTGLCRKANANKGKSRRYSLRKRSFAQRISTINVYAGFSIAKRYCFIERIGDTFEQC